MKRLEELAFEALELEKSLAKFVKLRKNYRAFKDISGIITDPEIKKLAQKNINVLKEKGRTADQLGILLGINSHYIYDAKAIMKTEPSLKDVILSRRFSLTDCRKTLKLPSDIRKKVLKKIYSGADSDEVKQLLKLYCKPSRVKNEISGDFFNVALKLKSELYKNIPAARKNYLIGSAYNALKTSIGGDRRSHKYETGKNTDVKLSEYLEISRVTVDRAGKFANIIDNLKIKNPKLAKDILAGKIKGALTYLISKPENENYIFKKPTKIVPK